MKYILTIDDDEALCKLVKKCIETAQVPVYTFLRGEDALSFFYQNQSDCVLVWSFWTSCFPAWMDTAFWKRFGL